MPHAIANWLAKKALKTIPTSTILDSFHQSKSEHLIKSFNDAAVESGNRAVINELQQQELDEQEETSRLEELFQQMKQRQGL